MGEKTKPKIFRTRHGILGWAPSDPTDDSVKLEQIETEIGTLFWVRSSADLERGLKPTKDMVAKIERKRPYLDIRSFFNCWLPLLFMDCLQDAARQSLRESLAIVEVKGTMDFPRERAKHLETVADQAGVDSLARFRLMNLYQSPKRGEKIRKRGTLGEANAKELTRFFDERNEIKKAIQDLMTEGTELTLRQIADRLNLGIPHPERERHTGIKKLSSMLKRYFPKLVPTQAVETLVSEISGERGEKHKARKVSRGKLK